MKKYRLAVGIGIWLLLLVIMPAGRSQDVPVPCLPCEPFEPNTCSLCHTW